MCPYSFGGHPVSPSLGHGVIARRVSLGLIVARFGVWGTRWLRWPLWTRHWRTCSRGWVFGCPQSALGILWPLPGLFRFNAQFGLSCFGFLTWEAWSHFLSHRAFSKNHLLCQQSRKPDATYFQIQKLISQASASPQPVPQSSDPNHSASHQD